MAKKLVDTNIFIDFLKGKKEAQVFFEGERNLSTSVVVVMEIIIGLPNEKEINLFEKFLYKSKTTIYPFTADISEKAYLLFRQHQKSHGINIPDAFIAATALVQKQSLVTRNIKHFQMVKNLTVLKPYTL